MSNAESTWFDTVLAVVGIIGIGLITGLAAAADIENTKAIPLPPTPPSGLGIFVVETHDLVVNYFSSSQLVGQLRCALASYAVAGKAHIHEDLSRYPQRRLRISVAAHMDLDDYAAYVSTVNALKMHALARV